MAPTQQMHRDRTAAPWTQTVDVGGTHPPSRLEQTSTVFIYFRGATAQNWMFPLQIYTTPTEYRLADAWVRNGEI